MISRNPISSTSRQTLDGKGTWTPIPLPSVCVQASKFNCAITSTCYEAKNGDQNMFHNGNGPYPWLTAVICKCYIWIIRENRRSIIRQHAATLKLFFPVGCFLHNRLREYWRRQSEKFDIVPSGYILLTLAIPFLKLKIRLLRPVWPVGNEVQLAIWTKYFTMLASPVINGPSRNTPCTSMIEQNCRSKSTSL